MKRFTSPCSCFGECGPYCGDGFVKPGEECDDANGVDGDGCDTTCYFSRYACDVQCCDGSWQALRARTAEECRSYSGGLICNYGGGWGQMFFNGSSVLAASCAAECGLECCSWSASQRVGGVFHVQDKAACALSSRNRCASLGWGVRNNLFYPNGVGGPIDWFIHTACSSVP